MVEKLRGSIVDSFAYITIKDRLPAILVKIVDSLAKELHRDQYDHAKLKELINRIGELRYAITRDRVLPESKHPEWNQAINEIPIDSRTWFNAPWLLIECYMYRLLQDMVEDSIPTLDLFWGFKCTSLQESMDGLQNLIVNDPGITIGCERLILKRLLKASLWGNQSDLSLSFENQETAENDTENILICDLDSLITRLMASRKLTMILDNAGLFD